MSATARPMSPAWSWNQRLMRAVDGGMDDRFEIAAGRDVVEDDGAKGAAIDAAVGQPDAGAEARDDAQRRPASRRAIAPCASVSASMVGTPRLANAASTWLLPVAMPPVSAARITGLGLRPR